ncbi:hypothetical protein ACXU4B_00690 [Dyella soli]|uniref:DUF2946 domain-containing protein n=1 Tax=Dyella soli TaxID=522319 RepID=A0A4R0YP12_9GAMM|nr:hypothetical protein [Dyella soli]TCI09595.1 hypothetical protein EZM97_11560 [Dyella soli]
MPRSLFRHLRRCRALFALALCAWLALASLAWADQGCCASSGHDMAMSMAMHHVAGSADHPPAHAHPAAPDGCCSHVAVTVLPSSAQAWPQAMPDAARWQARHVMAPQPDNEPPLRPPVA